MSCGKQQPPQSIIVAGTRYVDIVATSPSLAAKNVAETSTLLQQQQQPQQDQARQHEEQQQSIIGRIYLPPDEIDPEALKQVQSMCAHPACQNVRAMPDCCKGNGCSVGFTCKLTNCISPQIIGGDIACGIAAVPLPKRVVERRNGLERILSIIHDCIPMGGGASGVHRSAAIRLEQYAPFLEDATNHWREFNAAYFEKFGVNLDQYATQKYAMFIPPPHEAENITAAGNARMSSSPSQAPSFCSSKESTATTPTASGGGKTVAKFQYTFAWLQKRVQEWGITMDQMKCSLNSVGLGNHFVELGIRTDIIEDNVPISGGSSHQASTAAAAKNKGKEMKGTGGGGGKKGGKRSGGRNDKNDPSDDDDGDGDADVDHDEDDEQQRQQKDDNDEDDDENNAKLPEYLLSCHTGSRAVGQAIYRFWTKKCAQYQEARIQFQMLTQHRQSSGGKLTADQLQQLAQATATLAAATATSTNGGATPSRQKKASSVASETSSSKKGSKKRQQEQGNETRTSQFDAQNDVDDGQGDDDDDENKRAEGEGEVTTFDSNNLPLPKTDDDESIPFNTGFLLSSPEDLACYYMDVIYAQTFATMNRRAILSTIMYSLGDKAGTFSEQNMIETVHNYIDFRDFVVRKGAVRAHDGEKVLIGLNMKEGLWLCRGKGNPEWNFSCAHGCGRIMSRRAAGSATGSSGSNKPSESKAMSAGGGGKGSKKKDDPRIKEFKKEMGDVVTKSVNADTFDERPSVYRSSTLVRSLIEPAVDIVCRYKTILNAKGGSGSSA